MRAASQAANLVFVGTVADLRLVLFIREMGIEGFDNGPGFRLRFPLEPLCHLLLLPLFSLLFLLPLLERLGTASSHN